MMLVSHYSACKISFTMLPNNSSADSRLICQGEAPCSPFWCHIRALRPFSAPYMRPSALFDASYAPTAALLDLLYMHPFCSRLCVCKSPERFLNAGTQKVSKCTKNREKIHRRSHDHFQRIRFIITGGMN